MQKHGHVQVKGEHYGPELQQRSYKTEQKPQIPEAVEQHRGQDEAQDNRKFLVTIGSVCYGM